jgi:hypothetical protein
MAKRLQSTNLDYSNSLRREENRVNGRTIIRVYTELFVIPTVHLVSGNAWTEVLAITEIVALGLADLDFLFFAPIFESPLSPSIGAA